MTALTAVLLLYEPAGKYPRAIERLIAVLERLESVDARLIVVDNAREGDWEHQVSRSLLQIGGDNRAWEFSAFDKGLAASERWRPETEVVALVTDAFDAYGEEYLGLVDDAVIRCVTRLSACVGWMDSYGFERCRIGDLAYDSWMRTSFLFLPRRLVGLVSPLAADLDSAELFGSGPDRPFADAAPLSENLREMLLEWLTTRPVGRRRLPEQWHSRFELTRETLPFFQAKVRAILREHLVSARLEAAGVPCYDFRLLRRLADEGLFEGFLDQGGDPDRQWLGWLRPPGEALAAPAAEVPAAASTSVTAPDAGGATERNDDLPAIHHYWSNRYLRPKLQRFGLDSPNDLFRHYTERLCRASPDRRLRFVSLGGGGGELEVGLAAKLVGSGVENFTLECVAVDPALLDGWRRLAERQGVAGHLELSVARFVEQPAAQPCDAVLANQCLHRVAGLEELLDAIRAGLAGDGYFLAHEIVGGSGTGLSPEARELVDRLWLELPRRYRYNRALDRFEERVPEADAALQDAISPRQEILPLLLERFHFELFLGFANLIRPFIGRSFGANFDPDRETDRAFIDRVQAADAEAQRTGRIMPTRMLAAMTVADRGIRLCDGPMTAELAARRPSLR